MITIIIMNKIILSMFTVLILFIAGCSSTSNYEFGESKTLILTTFYPVEEITNAIVGNTSEIKILVGTGVEPHSYEPSPSQIVELSKADIFVTMEGIFENIEKSIIEANTNIQVIEANHNVNLIKGEEHHHDHGHEEEGHEEHSHEENHNNELLKEKCIGFGGEWIEEHEECEYISENSCFEIEGSYNECASACRNNPDAENCIMSCVPVCTFEKENHTEEGHEEHSHEKEGHEEHNHGEYDPHIWLSINNMKIMTKEVLEELNEIYPENKELYTENANQYLERLNILENEYKNRLANCKNDKIIVNHKAFGYIGEEYGFEQISVAGFSPESEPSPATIKEVIDQANEHNLTYIFSEGQIDPKTANTIANDIGGKVLELNPLKMNDNEDYFSIMRANLDNLAIGLNCQ
jgi:zinc transport system substrate-binding protein